MRALFAMLFSVAVVPAASLVPRPAVAIAPSQVTFEQATADLASTNAATRLRAVRMLKAAAYPEAALPLAPLVNDPQDDVQLEAIAAELNIFLAQKIVPRKRLAFVIERRTAIAADAAFSAGPLALGPQPVPLVLLTALRAGARDENPRVALEALYAFGTLVSGAAAAGRGEVQRTSGADLAAMLGAQDPALRFAAVRVLGRLFEWRRGDPPVDELVGDAVIASLSDPDRTIRSEAMQTLGAMRYERAVQGLTDLFQHFKSGALAEAALDAIAHIGHPYSSPLLSSQLTSRSATIRGIAMEGLGRTGDRTKVTEIEAALKTERNERTQLAGRFAAVLLTGAPIEPIGDVLSTARLHDQAEAYLIELAPGRTQAFVRYVQDPDEQVRADVADILGLAGDPAARPMLEPLAKDASPRVSAAATRAMAWLGKAEVGPKS